MSSYRTRNDKLSASATATNPSWPMWAAAWVVTAVFILSNSATPLYVRWQTEIGFSSTTLTAVFAAYILGLLLTLLVAGQLSDHFGRRPVLIPGLLAAIAACLLFAGATSVIELIAARFLSGVAVGVVVSAGMAAVVDLGGTERKRQASLIASVSMVLGAGLGPLLAGGIASAVIEPVVAIFAVELAILLSAGIALLILPLKQGSLGSDRPLRLHLPSVPPANRRHLLFGISIFGPGITATSFVLSLGPSLLSRLLEISSPLVAGGMACTMFLAATGIQFATHRLSVRTVFLMGAAATVFAMTGIVLAITFSNPIALVCAAVLAGCGQGLGQLGGLTLISLNVPGNNRAEANAVLNIGGYIPAGLMPVATGFVIDKAGLSAGATLFAIILTATALAGALTVARGVTDE